MPLTKVTGKGISNLDELGIGTASPNSALETVGSDGITISHSADTFLQCKTTGTTASNYIEFKDSGGASGNIQYNHTSNYLAFKVNGSERMRMLSGGGLTFNGDTATANALDDYEEGTWTPSVSAGAISGTSITYSGTYTKVGRSVLITFRAENSAGDINVSSYVIFSGVPFTIDKETSSTVVTEDIEQDGRHGFVSMGGTQMALSNCGSSSGTSSLRIGITGHIA
jgi:hypothetical protein